MTRLFWHKFLNSRPQTQSYSIFSRNSVQNFLETFLQQRQFLRKNKPNYLLGMEKSSIHIFRNGSYNLTNKKVNSSIPKNVPVVHKDSRWLRTITIEQNSKKINNKIIKLNVSVLDTFPDDVEQKRKTIVAVHGFPGSGRDFQSLAEKLHGKGIRLVAPTSPGMMDSPITVDLLNDIDFSTDGRTKTLDLILKAMNIHRVDMMIGHSAGAWTMYKAGATWENVGSLCGINPACARPNRTLRPFLFLRFIAALLLYPLGRWIIIPFMAQIYRMIGFRDVRADNGGIHLVASQQYVGQQRFQEVPVNAELIMRRQIPILFTYALNDRIVEPRICHHMAYSVLRIPADNTVMYTDDKTPSKDPYFVPDGWLARCLVFARGGHIVHVAHEKEIVEQIEDVLKYLSLSKRSSASARLANKV